MELFKNPRFSVAGIELTAAISTHTGQEATETVVKSSGPNGKPARERARKGKYFDKTRKLTR